MVSCSLALSHWISCHRDSPHSQIGSKRFWKIIVVDFIFLRKVGLSGTKKGQLSSRMDRIEHRTRFQIAKQILWLIPNYQIILSRYFGWGIPSLKHSSNVALARRVEPAQPVHLAASNSHGPGGWKRFKVNQRLHVLGKTIVFRCAWYYFVMSSINSI